MAISNALDINSAVFWQQLGTAVACGGAIGIERQLRGKAAGLRTSILICLGTELFVSLGNAFPGTTIDPTRVLGQVITGIGFLGAGVILAKDNRILGVTSAAVIWLLAALGGLIGFGHLATAFVITLVTIAVLVGIGVLEAAWARVRREKPARILDELEIAE
jgi:putative Mg2+ transporter-C (MgtC) family protein